MKKIGCILSGIFILIHVAYAQQRTNMNVEKKEDSIMLWADSVKTMAEKLIGSGFTAGEGYSEVWIRDFNTFMAVACHVNDAALIKKYLLRFFQFQQPDGQILDGYIPVSKSNAGYAYYHSPLAPEYAGHKNTVETDQESSLIQAITTYIRYTGDAAILQEKVAGLSIQTRLENALQFLLKHRMSEKYGLLWGATTIDWGDVQPEHAWGVVLDSSSHKAIDVYDNAMFVIAINDFLSVARLQPLKKEYWKTIQSGLKKKIRTYLWNGKLQKFKPHIYLDQSPFPSSFREDEISYHGGTAVATEAGILSKAEVKTAYQKMKADMEAAGAASIGLNNYPVYPEGFFKNPAMKPYSYQNGGDWTWFGGRMVTQLLRYGYRKEALEALQPMLQRVTRNKDFYEWYSRDNQPKGSAHFRGEAGVLWIAIEQLKNKKKAF